MDREAGVPVDVGDDEPVWIIEFLGRGVLPTCLAAMAPGGASVSSDPVDLEDLWRCTSKFGAELLLLGDVVATRGQVDHSWQSVVIESFPSREVLGQARERLRNRRGAGLTATVTGAPTGPRWTFTATAVETPPDLQAGTTHELDHVINIVMMSYTDPEHVERFLDATRGLAGSAGARREAWLEIRNQITDHSAGFDELFVSRYPTIGAWQALHDNEGWAPHSLELESHMAAFLDVVIQPRINRLATQRRD